MTIAIKLSELMQSNASLLELGAMDTLPPKAAYQVSRVIRKTRDEARAWNDSRDAIARQLFKDNPKALRPHPQMPGQIWIVTEALTLQEAEALDKALDELGDADVTIEATPMKLEALGAGTKLKPNLLADLSWLIVE